MPGERSVRDAQLLAGVRRAGPPGAATRRRAGARGRARRGARAAEPLDRLAVAAPRPASPSLSSARDRASMPERPVGARRARHARRAARARRGRSRRWSQRAAASIELGQRPADRRVTAAAAPRARAGPRPRRVS